MSHTNSMPVGKNNKYNSTFRFKELEEIEQETDWDDLVDATYPYYVKSKAKNILLTVESMLRIYILLRYFETSPSGIEKALLQLETLRDFALINIDQHEVPNAAHITDFSSILFEQSLINKIEHALKEKPVDIEYSEAF